MTPKTNLEVSFLSEVIKSRIGNSYRVRTEDAGCNPSGDIVIFSLFVIVIFLYIGLISSRKARHSYHLLNKAGILL